MKPGLTAVGLVTLCLALILPVQTLLAGGGVQMELEEVVRVEWRQIDEASRYKFYQGDVKLGRSLGGARFFVHDPDIDWDAVRVDAETFRGDPVGETEVIGTEIHQRLVVRWSEDDFDTPFIGIYARSDTGTSRTTQGLTEQPHVIPTEVESIQRVLFGEAVDRPDRRLPGAPFAFDNGEVESFGPYHDLSLP
ncbi:MAG: hypothetical protein JJU31_04905 [Wenzhouxiangella sp.]|nr:hypothetical protein [Wenzhouxiangella sp.]